MSMISELIKNLRALADFHNVNANLSYTERKLVNEAADTIEALSAKLSAANMERSERYYGGGWILCDKDNLPDKEVLCCDKHGEMILGYVSLDDSEETGFCAENDNEYMYNCIAYMPKPQPYKPNKE